MVRKISLGKALRKITSESTTDERTSVVPDIDKACAGGITEARSLSRRDIKASAKHLIALMDDFDRGEFYPAFYKFYSAIMAPSARAKGVFHPSQLMTQCKRFMCYDLLGTPPSDKIVSRGISGALQRTFDVGTWYHVYTQNILYKIGLLEQAEVPVNNPDKFISGSADGMFKTEVFGEPVVLEIKTMNDLFYKRAIFRPFKKHEFQASIYARELGAKKVLYLYINKNTSEMKDFLMPIDEAQLADADKIMNQVITTVKAKEILPRECPDKFCDNALICPFASLCFKE